ETLDRFGLEEREYVLYVSRMEPENNAHRVVEAFEKVKTGKKLVMVGDAPYASDYIAGLRATQDPRIIFTGYVFGQGYRELQSHAYCYVQATEVGGTHPALLEGMGYGNCVLANDVPEHHEVLGKAGCYFTTREGDSLRSQLQYLLDHPLEVARYRQIVRERVHDRYSWDKVTSDYEALFKKVAG
ncbi:MAG TPA: glycosyltransferase, partial [bacterium]|nr:glycosyltransferase [bacterium]